MALTKKFLIFASIFIFTLHFANPYVYSAPISEESDDDGDAETQDDTFAVDPMCNCNDPEALYYRIIRQFMNHRGEGKERFLKEFRPKRVCGSDGNYYKTRCALECAKAKDPTSDLHPSPRTCKKHGSKRLKKKSAKSMELRKAAEEKVEDQQSGKDLEKPRNIDPPRVCICTRHYSPVCASNGVTYGNMCVFRCAKETLDDAVTVVREGSCDDTADSFLQRQIK